MLAEDAESQGEQLPRSPLSQYAAEVEALTGEKVLREESAESDQENSESDKEATVEKVAESPEAVEPPKSAELDMKTLFQSREVQAEVDRRAAALERTRRAQYQREEQERIATESRVKSQKELEDLVEAANGDERDEATIEAQRKLATMTFHNLLRDKFGRELAPQIAGHVTGQIQQQLNEAYGQIEEFQDPKVMNMLHDSRFDNAGEWFVKSIDEISNMRVQRREQELAELYDTRLEKEANELAAVLTSQNMAEYRTTLHNPDTTPLVGDGKDQPRYRNRLELARDVDSLLSRGYSPQAIRQMREALPEADY